MEARDWHPQRRRSSRHKPLGRGSAGSA
jgi:hypothetical protein